jgi:secreted Zn-dependent insulinase-like peptidase
LSNNLQALLVSTGKAASDPEYDDDDGHRHHLDEDINSGALSAPAAQGEAAAVHVQAGHFDDTIPGLAHFHERKLYMIIQYSLEKISFDCVINSHRQVSTCFPKSYYVDMLFLGTEKYPSEDEYEGFLSKYGGLCNAYTDM